MTRRHSNTLDDLIELVKSTDHEIRLQAIKRLYNSGNLRAVPVLKKVVSTDPSVKVRYVARKALSLLRLSGNKRDEDSKQGSSSPEDEILDQSLEQSHLAINSDIFRRLFLEGGTEKRIELIQAAVRYGAGDLLDFLCSRTGTVEDVEVLASLAIAIGILGGEEVIPVLVRLLHDKDPRVRANAVEGLEYIGHPKVYPLITRYLNDPDNRIRANALKALKGYGKVNLIQMLGKMLDSDKPWMRQSAAYCLSITGSRSFLPLLKKGMKDPDREIRRRMRTALERLAGRGVAEAADCLAEFSDRTTVFHLEDGVETFDAFIERACGGDSPLFSDDADERKVEIERIVDEDRIECVPDLVFRLSEEDNPYLRASIVNAIGRLGDSSVAGEIVDCLDDPVARVRVNAIEALSALSPSLLAERADSLLNDGNNQVRCSAIAALKDIEPARVIAALASMVEHEDELFRRSAFWAVSDINDDRIIPFIGKFMEDESRDLRTRAAHYVCLLKEQNRELFDKIRASLSPRTAKLLETSMQRQALTRTFQSELPARQAVETAGKVIPPSISGIFSQYNFDDFCRLSKERKLDVIDEAKSVVNVGNYMFLREVLKRDDDFVVKVAVRRALKSFQGDSFSQERQQVERLGLSDILHAHDPRDIAYEGPLEVLQLSRNLIVRRKEQAGASPARGPFPEKFPLLNALREDSQEMISRIVGDEELILVCLCHFIDMFVPFIGGKRSLDVNRFANIVNLRRLYKSNDKENFDKDLLSGLQGCIYVLVLATDTRIIVFARGPIESRKARYREIFIRTIRSSDLIQDDASTMTVLLSLGMDSLRLARMRADDARAIQFHIEKIKKELSNPESPAG